MNYRDDECHGREKEVKTCRIGGGVYRLERSSKGEITVYELSYEKKDLLRLKDPAQSRNCKPSEKLRGKMRSHVPLSLIPESVNFYEMFDAQIKRGHE
ncbi:MAG: hypothetical protein QMD85_00675 [Candidatus Aenigmarchaeota archaeon]|nr:hypothetical protein [Candidatus Aenigmarchaeota archaeon]MDI6722041.1 hypothetical protein [Candidatus Aenigmarchaeota archaeon]